MLSCVMILMKTFFGINFLKVSNDDNDNDNAEMYLRMRAEMQPPSPPPPGRGSPAGGGPGSWWIHYPYPRLILPWTDNILD